MKAISECRLYAFVDTSCLRGRSPALVARQLCDGGADIIQVRAKGAPRDEVCRISEAALPVTRAAGIPLVINDDFTLARELGAEFCHLGQEDFFDRGFTDVTQLTHAAPQIGLSSHSPKQAQRALAAGASYLGVGPVYATNTKPEAEPVTLDYVRWAAANVTVPWFAIGGINLKNLDAVLAAGAKGICVVSAILNAEDVAQACREFKRRLS
jgi:thiamine-phosphate pyrophosphorylase